jgi:hypothetical protein
MTPAFKKRRLGKLSPLAPESLYTVLEKAIAYYGTPEMAIMYLTQNYSFDLEALEAKIRVCSDI